MLRSAPLALLAALLGACDPARVAGSSPDPTWWACACEAVGYDYDGAFYRQGMSGRLCAAPSAMVDAAHAVDRCEEVAIGEGAVEYRCDCVCEDTTEACEWFARDTGN